VNITPVATRPKIRKVVSEFGGADRRRDKMTEMQVASSKIKTAAGIASGSMFIDDYRSA
jgi:hypothetical protein